MLDQDELRQFPRINDICEIVYQFPDKEVSYKAECLNISGNGIFFVGDRLIGLGKALEIRSAVLSALAPSMVAYVEVVRCEEIEQGKFEVGVEIKGIKAS